ncbi:GNAT family protein [uncultured Sunxiuqinia sp.]|uniref:GNAT family N-acetyltransferase n=1 Tax=uncultured Sunxiuqinia sp. TaxID=1573825 RepID=UPI00261C9E02|nr:GNAT family protein [uncultured Sunxiuqinia sp.]
MKLKARCFASSDINDRVEWINNPKVNQTMFFELPATIEKTARWYKDKDNRTRVDFTFADEQGAIVGMGGFTQIDRGHKHAEFYIMIAPLLHGRGLGKRIANWMYNYAFLEIKLNKIYLYTNDDNVAAYSIYEKAGFKLEGILREHKCKDGMLLNRRFYGLLRSEWENQPWKKDILEYEL